MLHRLNENGLIDRAAMMLSGLCAVHCVVTAVLIAILASAGGLLFSHTVHEIGLVIAIILGAIALGYGAMRHGYVMPLAIGSLGIGIMMGALDLPHDGSEVLFTIIGVAVLALGHDLNYRATH